MKEISMPSGHVCQVDDADYDYLNSFRWYIGKQRNNVYARMIIETINRRHKFSYMHKVIYPDAKEVDHRDNNGLNNQRDNLRICSHSDNMKNRHKITGTSKYRGVSRHLGYCWLAKINIDGKQKHLGCFKDEKEAALAYNKAAIVTGNEYYVLNIIALV